MDWSLNSRGLLRWARWAFSRPRLTGWPQASTSGRDGAWARLAPVRVIWPGAVLGRVIQRWRSSLIGVLIGLLVTVTLEQAFAGSVQWGWAPGGIGVPVAPTQESNYYLRS